MGLTFASGGKKNGGKREGRIDYAPRRKFSFGEKGREGMVAA
jgi:hypothetical protein